MKNIKLTTVVLAIFLLAFSHVSLAKNNDTQVKTFYLKLWAPDQVAPADAKPVEYGDSYQYKYTPESHKLTGSDQAHDVVFKFHPDLKNRYQFRWLSADQPQFVSLKKAKKHKMKVKVDTNSSEYDQDIYFEVWVLDTKTGKVLMCDPAIQVKE